MTTIEKYHNYVNTTKEFTFSDGENYRQNITRYIEPFLDTLEKHQNLLVIGAGNCQDVPLKFFINKFNHIVLTDISMESILKGIDDYNLSKEERKKIESIRIEYTGIEKENLIETLIRDLNDSKGFKAIEKRMERLFNNLENYSFLNQRTFSVIYVTPIYTQLVYQQVLDICRYYKNLNYSMNDINLLEQYFLNKMMDIINRFNHTLIKRLEEDGVMIVLSDIFEAQTNTDFMKKIEKSIDDNDQMNELHESYINQYGYGLGDYGLLSLLDKMEKTGEKWLIWPFSKNRHFVVKMLGLRKLKG